MPVGRLLEAVRDVEEPRFGQRRPLDQQPDRQALAIEAAGNREARRAGQVAGDGEDVAQVHLHRVVGVLAEAIRRARRHRAHEHVALRVGTGEIVGDEPAHLLRLHVVRIVVAVREDVGAGEDASLDFGTEALGARLLVHVDEIGVVRGAMTVAHAVEAREIR